MTAPPPGHLLRLHRQLDRISRTTDRGRFVSGWRTEHPFVRDYLPDRGRLPEQAAQQLDSYSFLSDSGELVRSIQRFHAITDGVNYPADAIYIGPGSSPLLSSFFLALAEMKLERIFYIPPVYYLCYYLSANLGISMHEIGPSVLHDEKADLQLPNVRTALLISDPIWIFGTLIRQRHVATLAAWQRKTGSIILVDGTFQYTKWDRTSRAELTAQLDPDLTFRIVCPTKSLAVHGIRFAYMLLPPRHRESIRYACSNITGATSAVDEQLALQLMGVLASTSNNAALVDYIKKVRDRLWERGIIQSESIAPEASYYVFAELNHQLVPDAIGLDHRFFGVPQRGNHIRVNLLHATWQTI